MQCKYADIQRCESEKVNIKILSLAELAKALEPKDLLDFNQL